MYARHTHNVASNEAFSIITIWKPYLSIYSCQIIWQSKLYASKTTNTKHRTASLQITSLSFCHYFCLLCHKNTAKMTMWLRFMASVLFFLSRQLKSLCENTLKMIFNDLFAPTPIPRQARQPKVNHWKSATVNISNKFSKPFFTQSVKQTAIHTSKRVWNNWYSWYFTTSPLLKPSFVYPVE